MQIAKIRPPPDSVNSDPLNPLPQAGYTAGDFWIMRILDLVKNRTNKKKCFYLHDLRSKNFVS